jgi:RimJ/RimL family protein N-acetyltransferase
MSSKPAVNYAAGDKVMLAPLETAHIQRYIEFSGDSELVATMGWRPFAAGETARFMEAIAALTVPGCVPSEVTVFSILDSVDGTPSGYVCLKGVTPARRSAELGIALMDVKYRDGGRGTEALGLALRYGFEEMGLDSVALTVFPENRRAVRAYEKAGFRAGELLSTAWEMPDGRRVDLRLMECRRGG